MNPDNPVIKLCVAGMEAEWEGRPEDALVLFMQAWDARQDDFDACIAAHYVARHQPTPEATLHWNQLALDFADKVGDERVEGFYPSLYLNLGKSHEVLGDSAVAAHYYELAAARAGALPDSPYKNMVQFGIGAGQGRQNE
jgi:hypothetical protein